MKPEEIPLRAVNACKVSVEHHELIHDDDDTGYCDQCLRLKLSAAFLSMVKAGIGRLTVQQVTQLGAYFNDGAKLDESSAQEWREALFSAIEHSARGEESA